MSLAEIGQLVTAALVSAVLIWAAVSDIRERRIPNRLVLLVLALSVPWLFITGAPIGSALAAGAIALAIGFGLFAFRILGAGDAKLFSALALFAGLAHLPTLAIATALAGGVMAVGALASRPRRALVMITMRGAGDWGRGIPYGVAIAVGGCLMLWNGAIAPLPALQFAFVS